MALRALKATASKVGKFGAQAGNGIFGKQPVTLDNRASVATMAMRSRGLRYGKRATSENASAPGAVKGKKVTGGGKIKGGAF